MPSMRALNSMSTQPARAHSPPAQPLAAILLSLAIPLMLLPTSPYRPSTPSPPIMPCTAHSHPQMSHPNHPARSTPHPRATHTKHTSPLPALLDGTGLLQMSSKGTSHKVERDRITAKRSHTKDTRKPQKTHVPQTRPPSHSDTHAHQSGHQSIPDKQTPPLTHTKPKPTTHTLRATNSAPFPNHPSHCPQEPPEAKGWPIMMTRAEYEGHALQTETIEGATHAGGSADYGCARRAGRSRAESGLICLCSVRRGGARKNSQPRLLATTPRSSTSTVSTTTRSGDQMLAGRRLQRPRKSLSH